MMKRKVTSRINKLTGLETGDCAFHDINHFIHKMPSLVIGGYVYVLLHILHNGESVVGQFKREVDPYEKLVELEFSHSMVNYQMLLLKLGELQEKPKEYSERKVESSLVSVPHVYDKHTEEYRRRTCEHNFNLSREKYLQRVS